MTLSYITSKKELEALIETLIERRAVSVAEVSYAREKFSNRLTEQQGESLDGQEPVEQEERGFFGRCLDRLFRSEK